MAGTQVEKKEPSLSELIKRTDKESPDSKDIELMKGLLDNNAAFVESNAAANHAFHRVIDSLTNKSFLVKELYNRNIEKRRNELDYHNENAMIRMLIDNLILCQIRMTAFEAAHAERLSQHATIKEGLYFDKLLTNYHRRFAKACEALASVKRVLCEADLLAQRARVKRGQSTLQSQRILREATR